MASDWMVMRDEHAVLGCVSVGWDEFHRIREIVDAARAFNRLVLLRRLEDYWQDADFALVELAPLRGELVEVRDIPGLDPPLRCLIASLVELSDLAMREKQPIEVRAD